MENTTPQPSLMEYAAASGALSARCLLCSVPLEIEEQVQRGKAHKVTYRLICQWLESLGHENVTKGRLEKHFLNNHVHPAKAATL